MTINASDSDSNMKSIIAECWAIFVVAFVRYNLASRFSRNVCFIKRVPTLFTRKRKERKTLISRKASAYHWCENISENTLSWSRHVGRGANSCFTIIYRVRRAPRWGCLVEAMLQIVWLGVCLSLAAALISNGSNCCVNNSAPWLHEWSFRATVCDGIWRLCASNLIWTKLCSSLFNPHSTRKFFWPSIFNCVHRAKCKKKLITYQRCGTSWEDCCTPIIGRLDSQQHFLLTNL